MKKKTEGSCRRERRWLFASVHCRRWRCEARESQGIRIKRRGGNNSVNRVEGFPGFQDLAAMHLGPARSYVGR